MKSKRFTEEQIIAVLKEAEAGAKTKDLCRKYGISDVTFYNWKAKYAGLTVSEARRLKELEAVRRCSTARLFSGCSSDPCARRRETYDFNHNSVSAGVFNTITSAFVIPGSVAGNLICTVARAPRLPTI